MPHQLGRVIEFVNTLDRETEVDELSTPIGLRTWLVDRQLLDPDGPPIGEPERRQAIRLREALRAVLLAHNGLEPDPEAAAELDRVAQAGRLSVQFAADGSAALRPRARGFAGALAGLLAAVAAADADGSWQRAKACRADDCEWAFYDHSRNRSGVWCDMAVCGNRTKVRAYRARKP
jgi:predicted RNA-binding Zn ribbon-like protein